MGNIHKQLVQAIQSNPCSSTAWKGFFTFYAAGDLSESFDLTHFAVTGGAKRKIELAVANDVIISSEMEQAKSFKNISVYLKRERPSSGTDLVTASKKNLSAKISIILSRMRGLFSQERLILTCEKTIIKDVNRDMTDSNDKDYWIRAAFTLSNPRLMYSRGNSNVEEM